MLKTSSRVALGFLVLYAGALLAFTFFHYGGDRPGAGTVLGDFHAWLGIGTTEAPPPAAPVPVEDSAAPPPGAAPATAAPPPEPPTIGPAPSATPPAVSEADLDAAERLLAEAEAGGKELRSMDRGPLFEEKLRTVLGKLGEAREILNRALDASPKSTRGNKLWMRLQQIHGAAKRL